LTEAIGIGQQHPKASLSQETTTSERTKAALCPYQIKSPLCPEPENPSFRTQEPGLVKQSDDITLVNKAPI